MSMRISRILNAADALRRSAAASVSVFALALGLSGCGGASVSTQARAMDVASPSAQPPKVTLIPSDGESLSDAELHRILSAHPALPPKVRIAIVHLGHASL